MRAWQLVGVSNLNENDSPLLMSDVSTPVPGKDEILIEVSCCGICHTELDEIEGRVTPSFFPIIPGHQVIGIVVSTGTNVKRFRWGDRVGVAWISSVCGTCEYCISGKENLCASFQATGKDRNGGYAEYMKVNENYAYTIPSVFSDAEAAPLLCAGAIGYRSLTLAGIVNGQTLGLVGFGASGHLVLKLAKFRYPDSKIFVFSKNEGEQKFALSLGADWAGTLADHSPQLCNTIIDTTPVWAGVTSSMLKLKPGGRLVINAIRKETNDQNVLLNIQYQNHLWMEKEIKSVTNITRADVEQFLKVAAQIPIEPKVDLYPFEKANVAIMDLKRQHATGAKVLVIG